MSLINVPFTFTVGAVIVASQHNSNFSTIYNDYNGGITTANIASNAGITDTQLAAITTAGKVSGAALTSLASVPSGAGLLPIANIPVGTTASKIVQLDGSAKLPAVDGSALTGLNVGFSATSSGSAGSAYLAATAGIVTADATFTAVGNATMNFYSDTNNPPTTLVRTVQLGNSSGTNIMTLCEPVLKNYYWKITVSNCSINNAIRFYPLGV